MKQRRESSESGSRDEIKEDSGAGGLRNNDGGGLFRRRYDGKWEKFLSQSLVESRNALSVRGRGLAYVFFEYHTPLMGNRGADMILETVDGYFNSLKQAEYDCGFTSSLFREEEVSVYHALKNATCRGIMVSDN